MTRSQVLYDRLSRILLALGGHEYDDGDALVTEVEQDS
jgi:hypothetical protein